MTSPIVKAEGGWTAGPWRVSGESPKIIKVDHRMIGIEEGQLIASTCGHPCSGFFPTDEQAIANAARIVYAVNNIDRAVADRNSAQASNINAMQVIAARDKEIRGKDARIAGLEAAGREMLVEAERLLRSCNSGEQFCVTESTLARINNLRAALEGSKPE